MRVGIFYPGPWLSGGTERHALGIAAVLSTDDIVEILTFYPGDWDELGRRLNLNLNRVRFRAVPEMAADALTDYTKGYDLWLDASPWHLVPSRSPKSALLVVYPPPLNSSVAYRVRHAVGVRAKSIAWRGEMKHVVSRLMPGFGRRLRLLSAVEPRRALATYQLIMANSAFTRTLIYRRWGRESVVLYPPIDTESFRPLVKRNMVLSVGRFGYGGNNKKHLVLIAAFRSLVDRGLKGWELHLAGATHDNPRDRAYLDSIQQAASGCPIVVHPDCRHEDLRQLYGESAIYWHGAGYGEDDARNPLAVEHFGITTVEAMAAGCIPIVCGRGGQPEIVQHRFNGFLWTGLEELKRYTLLTIRSRALSDRLRVRAMERSCFFGTMSFAKRVREILGDFDYPHLASSRHH